MHFLQNVGFNDKQVHPISHNKMVLRKHANRTIMECAKNMILAQRLKLEFWGETMSTMVYIKN
jgi:hypothetical protein